MDRRQIIGRLGEEKAEKYLIKNGWEIIERNYRTRYGEVDIIAREDDEIVFVEVRARSSGSFGTPEESITFKKQLKIKNMAKYYLSVNNLNRIGCRFDVVAIIFDGSGKLLRFNHIRGAF
ncbi:MAG TPA: YraN family protein [Clostridia bacterium]|nr:YraN family protein [Clostridia bacterium]